ncbi:MAG: hypothetical protein AAFY70_02355 [Bacteroidota bacterium]
MKKNLIMGLGVLSILLMIIACNQEKGVLSELKQDVPALPFAQTFPTFTQSTTVGGIRIPDHSRIILSEDGTSVTFQFPENVFWVTQDDEGNVVKLAARTYVCECSDGSCNVLHTGNDFGCLHGSCSGTCSGYYADEPPSTERNVSGGFIDLNQGVAVVTSEEEAENLLDYDPSMLALGEVQEGLQLLKLHQVAILNGDYDVREPSRTIAFNFYGTLIGVNLPISYIQTLENHGSFKNVSCFCRNGRIGCILRGDGTGGIWICSGDGCSSCAMIVEDDSPGQD